MKQAANLDVQDLDRTTKTRTITIDPVTRIEGHARVFINQGAHGEIESAGLVVNELRGFERILVGMEADRMPLITARICGVCPTAHHLAATNALDQAAGVTPPDAALLLRELMFMGHLIHSHSLSLFVLQGPDIILGLDADPAIRNVLGVVQAQPDIALKALRIRSIGQKINEMIGGRGTHPVTSVAGGITFTIDSGKLAQLTSWIDEALVLAKALVPILKDLLLKQLERNPAVTAWATSSWSLGTMKDGRVSFTDGRLTVVDDIGDPQTTFSAIDYDHFLCETVVDWSYMKPVRLKANGQFRDYRVGPMARMNVAACYGTPWADQELAYFKDTVGIPCHQTAYQPYARLVELIFAVERAAELARDPRIVGETRVPAKFKPGRAVGHIEAPRGTLFHDYEIDEQGIVRAANLIVATQQNYALINSTIEQAAMSHVIGKEDDLALLNAIEFGIRCYDPCLSCATHAVGMMPLEVVINAPGSSPRVIRRPA